MRLVLLHAHARTGLSMRSLAHVLKARGHETHIIGYRSRHAPLRVLAGEVAAELRTRGLADGGSDVGFITHSMGGVVLRALPLALPEFRAGRSICLGGPLNGAIAAEVVGKWPLAPQILGPAFAELTRAAVEKLPLAPCDYGSIAGTRWTPLLPAAHVLRRVAPGQPSDSTVLVSEARGPSGIDHAEVDEIHTFLPANKEVHQLVVRFLDTGSFR